MNVLKVPSFYASLDNFIQQCPPAWDSETALARHIAEGVETVTAKLGLSDEPLLCSDGAVFVYSKTQGIWEPVALDTLISISQMYDGVCTPQQDDAKAKRIRIGYQRAGNISRSLYHLHDLQADKFFEAPTPGIAFTNGFCEVTDYGPELSEHDSDHRATVAYDFDLDEEIEPPQKWLEFLNSLWDGDKDKHNKIAVLQEFLGASIANIATTYQKSLLYIGTGSNGKSVLMDLCGELLFPEGTVTYISPRKFDRDYSLAGLRNSRINLVSELPETNVLEQTDVFKQVVTGEAVEARLPYQSPFFVRPKCGHIFSANELPRTRDSSRGFFRRFIIFEFKKNFEKSMFRKTKEEIKADLLPERSAIIMWALHGAARLIRQNEYTGLESHREAIDDWQQESDAVYDFATSCLDYPSNDKSSLKNLRENYQEWAQRVGRSQEIGNKTLSKRLAKLDGIVKGKTSRDTVFNCSIRPIRDWDEASH